MTVHFNEAQWYAMERRRLERLDEARRRCNAANAEIIRKAELRERISTLVVALVAACIFALIALSVSSAMLGGGQ